MAIKIANQRRRPNTCAPDDRVRRNPFAASEDGEFKGGYNIDRFNDDANGVRSVCLIDSVGSQANRMEPMFKRDVYKALVPQIEIRAGTRLVNLLDAGHRAADAIVRCSALKDGSMPILVEIPDGSIWSCHLFEAAFQVRLQRGSQAGQLPVPAHFV